MGNEKEDSNFTSGSEKCVTKRENRFISQCYHHIQKLGFGELFFSLELMAQSSTRNHVCWEKTDWHLLPFRSLGRMGLGNCHLFCSDTFSMLLAQRSLWSPWQPGKAPSMSWKEGPACLVWLTLFILCFHLTHCRWRPIRPTSQPFLRWVFSVTVP